MADFARGGMGERRTTSSVLSSFLLDRQARGLSKNTIRFYRDELGLFYRWLEKYCSSDGAIPINAITPELLRAWFVHLGTIRNRGGVHTSYRALKALLNWFEDEEDGDFRNPIRKVKIPAGHPRARAGVGQDQVGKLCAACRGSNALRDQTILRCLLDTGARAFEFLALDVGDVDLQDGAVKIQHGKGDKERTVYIGTTSRRWLKRYLKARARITKLSPLFVTDAGERFTVSGLRQIVRRRAAAANMEMPGLHDFRRGCGRLLLRNGMNLEYIRQYLGHKSLDVTRRYLGTEDPDIEQSFRSASPVDNIRW
jgi:integrase/recombinase XerD